MGGDTGTPIFHGIIHDHHLQLGIKGKFGGSWIKIFD